MHQSLESQQRHEISNLRDYIEKQAKVIEHLKTRTCVWNENECGGWDACGNNIFEVTDGTPADNHMKFCPFCGGNIVIGSLYEE